MSSKKWMEAFYKDKLKHGSQAMYWQTTHNKPHDGKKQCAKKWNNHTSRTGHVTIGKAARNATV